MEKREPAKFKFRVRIPVPAPYTITDMTILHQGENMKLHVVFGQTLKSGVRVVVGSIPFEALNPYIDTPWRNAVKKTGYQRKPTQARINRLVSEIRKRGVDIPTAILLNARHKSWQEAIVEHGDRAEFDLSKYRGKLWIVDGQHRTLALKQLYEESPEVFGKFKLQFVMMLGASEAQELEQFYVVNSTAKSVKTDLALDLLKQRADQDGKVMQHLLETGQDWKVRAQGFVEKLNVDSNVWAGRIRLANEEKGKTIIPSSSFVSSLQAFLEYPYIKSLSPEKQYAILEAYWTGIRSAIREPFDFPSDYTLQKGIGVWAMHEIFPHVLEVVRSKGDPLLDPASYKGVLTSMFESLEGENREADNVRGPDFWLTAPKGGVAGGYSSSAGKRVLLSKLANNLPEPEVE